MKKHQFYKKTVSIGILNIGILNAFQEFRLLTRAARISPNSVADTYPAIVTGYKFWYKLFPIGVTIKDNSIRFIYDAIQRCICHNRIMK
jgi:hypothetical protein